MDLLLSFAAGLVLAGIVSLFVILAVRKKAAGELQKSLEDAEKQSAAKMQAATAALEADLKNARSNLEQVREDDSLHTRQLLEAKQLAHEQALEDMEKRHSEALAAM